MHPTGQNEIIIYYGSEVDPAASNKSRPASLTSLILITSEEFVTYYSNYTNDRTTTYYKYRFVRGTTRPLQQRYSVSATE